MATHLSHLKDNEDGLGKGKSVETGNLFGGWGGGTCMSLFIKGDH